MLTLKQSEYDFLLLSLVVVLSVAANLPDDVTPIDKRVLVASLVVILIICLVRYVRLSLVLVTAVLAAGANLPEGLAEQFGVETRIMLFTLGAMVALAIFNHFTKTIPKGTEPQHVARTVHGGKALFEAVLTGKINVVQVLVQSGVNVNVCTLTGRTPLMVATYQGHVDIVQMLLNAGARANEKDTGGNSALNIAKFRGYSQIVAFLKMAGAEDAQQFLDVAGITGTLNAQNL